MNLNRLLGHNYWVELEQHINVFFKEHKSLLVPANFRTAFPDIEVIVLAMYRVDDHSTYNRNPVVVVTPESLLADFNFRISEVKKSLVHLAFLDVNYSLQDRDRGIIKRLDKFKDQLNQIDNLEILFKLIKLNTDAEQPDLKYIRPLISAYKLEKKLSLNQHRLNEILSNSRIISG